MKADRRLTPEAIDQIRAAVEEAGGNEVFLVGTVGDDGRVASVRVGARGNEEAVPVLSPHLEDGGCVIHNHPSGGTRPSNADLSIASRLGNQGIGFYIVDNTVEEVYVVAEPVAAREIVLLDAGQLADAISPGGALSRLYPLYENRESQVE
ncbi:MAG TPA: helicase c2, partial [Spirochaetia bacterium]|nr:helicase c2 [Spirochaetia bacterium]